MSLWRWWKMPSNRHVARHVTSNIHTKTASSPPDARRRMATADVVSAVLEGMTEKPPVAHRRRRRAARGERPRSDRWPNRRSHRPADGFRTRCCARISRLLPRPCHPSQLSEPERKPSRPALLLLPSRQRKGPPSRGLQGADASRASRGARAAGRRNVATEWSCACRQAAEAHADRAADEPPPREASMPSRHLRPLPCLPPPSCPRVPHLRFSEPASNEDRRRGCCRCARARRRRTARTTCAGRTGIVSSDADASARLSARAAHARGATAATRPRRSRRSRTGGAAGARRRPRGSAGRWRDPDRKRTAASPHADSRDPAAARWRSADASGADVHHSRSRTGAEVPAAVRAQRPPARGRGVGNSAMGRPGIRGPQPRNKKGVRRRSAPAPSLRTGTRTGPLLRRRPSGRAPKARPGNPGQGKTSDSNKRGSRCPRRPRRDRDRTRTGGVLARFRAAACATPASRHHMDLIRETRTRARCGQQALDLLGDCAGGGGGRRAPGADLSGRAARRERPRSGGDAARPPLILPCDVDERRTDRRGVREDRRDIRRPRLRRARRRVRAARGELASRSCRPRAKGSASRSTSAPTR